jgi:hypothetical protein
MSATPPTPLSRPRAVNVAFGCWVAADILTAALGLLLISSPAPVFIRAAGGLLIVVGLAHGFLAGRARSGNKRFEYAGVALSLASVAFLAVLLLFFFGASVVAIVIVATIMALTITGSAMMQGKPAQAWFDGEGDS